MNAGGESGLGLAVLLQIDAALGEQVAALGQRELMALEYVIGAQRLGARPVVAQRQQVQRLFILNLNNNNNKIK